MTWPVSWLIMSTAYWYKRNLLPSLKWCSTLISLIWSAEFMSQTSKLVFLDISLVRILYAHHVSVQYFSLMCKDSFTSCIANTVLLPAFHWMYGGVCSHAHLTSWGGQDMLCLDQMLKIVWSDLHTSIFPALYPCSLYHIWLTSYCYSLCKCGSPDDIICKL